LVLCCSVITQSQCGVRGSPAVAARVTGLPDVCYESSKTVAVVAAMLLMLVIRCDALYSSKDVVAVAIKAIAVAIAVAFAAQCLKDSCTPTGWALCLHHPQVDKADDMQDRGIHQRPPSSPRHPPSTTKQPAPLDQVCDDAQPYLPCHTCYAGD
jgi:hypothetical protein